MEKNRPRGRERNTSDTGKGVQKKGAVNTGSSGPAGRRNGLGGLLGGLGGAQRTGSQSGQRQERQNLDSQGIQMPSAQSEIVRGNLHKLEKQQEGDYKTLPFRHQRMQPRAQMVQARHKMIDKVQADSQHNRAGKHPLFQKMQHPIHVREPAGRKVCPARGP